MNTHGLFRLSCFAAFSAGAALCASAELLVYDGLPLSGTGAYTGNNAKLYTQNRTHASIVGETNAWQGIDTGTILVTNGWLNFPSGIFLLPLEGAVLMQSTASSSTTTRRSLSRALTTPIGERSFYFSVLMAYNDLSAYASGQYAVWGLTQTKAPGGAYPTDDGILMGFQRSATGVDAIVRVLNQSYVIQSGLTPGTYHFVGRFDYNGSGSDTVYASLAPGRDEPTVWATNIVAEVLTSGQSLGHVNVGFNYGINNNWVMVDEWRAGGTYADVVGTSASAPFVINQPATTILATSAWLNGTVSSTGTAVSAVSVYYGETDAGTNTAAWQAVYHFPTPATEEPQPFSYLATNLTPFVRCYYRYAASNAVGQVIASSSATFLPQPQDLPVVSNAAAGLVSTTSATLTGFLGAAWPATSVFACWGTTDGGTDGTSAWARVALVGTFSEPSSLSYGLTGLVANNGYVCRFFATNELGSCWSAAIGFTTTLPTVSITDAYVNEGNAGLTPISLAVTLNTPNAQDATLHYATRDSSATSGVDYVAASGVLTIPAGITSTSLTFSVIGNTIESFPGKRFWVDLSSPVGLTVGTATAEAGILDDDMGKRLFFDDFNDDNANGWSVLGGTWSVASKTYKISQSDSGGTSVAGDAAWSNYGIRTMAKETYDWKFLGLRAYYTNASTGYSFAFERSTGSGTYDASLRAGSSLLKATGFTAIPNTRAGDTVLRPIAMRVRTTKEGTTRIQCYIGFTPVFDVIDATNTFTQGKIGLYGGGYAEAYFDNVEVFAEAPPRGTAIYLR